MTFDSLGKRVDDYIKKKEAVDSEEAILSQDERMLDSLRKSSLDLDRDILENLDELQQEYEKERRLIDSEKSELEEEKKEITDDIFSEEKKQSEVRQIAGVIETMRYGKSADKVKAQAAENTRQLKDLLSRINDKKSADNGLSGTSVPSDSIVPDKVVNDNKKEKEYLDDNGVKFREGDNLIPNSSFVVNGYTYKTDEEGRVVSAEGKLRMRSPDYDRHMEDVRHKDGQAYNVNDDRGHLIAHRFGGSDKLENLLPMDSKLNRVDYKALEDDLERAVGDGNSVYLKVEPVFEDNSTRPTKFRVTYSIDGLKRKKVFDNESEDPL